MMRLLTLLWPLLCLLAGAMPTFAAAPAADPAAPTTPVPTAKPEPPPPYDAAPFLQALSKPYRNTIAKKLNLNNINELPLYQLEIDLDAILGTLQVHQEVIFTNTWKEPLGEIALRTYPNSSSLVKGQEKNLALGEVTVNGAKAEVRQLNPTAFVVPLPAPLAHGERVRVGMDFKSVIPRLPPGSGSMGTAGMQDIMSQMKGNQSDRGYGVYASADGVINLGFFYPILPARLDGAWDTEEPAGMGDPAHFDVANYLVKMKVPKLMAVASSGIQVGEKALGPGPEHKKEVYLLGTALRDFALELSTRYTVLEAAADDIKVRYFTIEEDEKNAKQVLDQAVGSLRFFQKTFGPYPYSEFHVADAPLIGGAGGMEYPGLITVAMAMTSGPSGQSPMNDLFAAFLKTSQTVEFVVVHEVAHQWWHALVGSDSNRHPFLDESLANYTPVLYFESKHGQASAQQQVQMELAMPYQLFRMMGGKDGSVDRPVAGFSSQLEYSALVYGKGAMFYQALRAAMGKAAFLRFLKTYADRFALREALPDDLLKAAMDSSGNPKKVQALYQRWIQEEHGDEDIGKLDMSSLSQVMSQLQKLAGGNVQLDGQIDPAVLKAFQQAVQQLTTP